MRAVRFDVPTPDDESQPFWDAARDGRLLIKRCAACGRAHHYPRPFCPYCWSRDVIWEQAAGTGTVYTFSVVHRNDLPPFNERVPYVAAVVELDEGPRMMTNVVDCDVDDVTVGMPVEVTFRAIDDTVTVPVFRPASGYTTAA
ncbi:MAG: Zn-ribbon domain-containing OB-fold protein [Acidimicrobiia bacterium]|nr:Zn-ribbon domain-containing OB-fold protein [Acidimicrobiia bacterium]